jgi:hypothetical protein
MVIFDIFSPDYLSPCAGFGKTLKGLRGVAFATVFPKVAMGTHAEIKFAKSVDNSKK